MKKFTFITFSFVGALFVSGCATTRLSPALPENFSNCISEKDADGKVVSGPKIALGPTVKCKMDSQGRMLGTTLDGVSVEDSDAIRACRHSGGRLPTAAEISNHAGEIYANSSSRSLYWTATIHSNPSKTLALVYNASDGDASGGESRYRLLPVHCIAP